jgi:hypothetical protein
MNFNYFNLTIPPPGALNRGPTKYAYIELLILYKIYSIYDNFNLY